MIRFRHAFAVAAFAALAPSMAMAQACPGPSTFNDVAQNDIFCKNVQWLANRQITLGCDTALYCPNQNVLRSQMALFMNRLGTALTPNLIRVQDANVNGDYDPPLVGCVSDPVVIAANSFPRQASFHASLMNYNASAAKMVTAAFVYRTDGGAWTPTGDYEMWQLLSDGQARLTMGLVGGPLPLAVGATYEFGILASTNNFSATVQGECQMLVRIENRNPETAPF